VTRTIRMAIAVGWALTGGQGGGAALRRALVRVGCRLPGASAAALRAASPRLAAGPLVRRSLRFRALAGTLCPQPGGADGWFDDTLGDGFALVTAGPLAEDSTPAGVRVVPAEPGGPVAAWLRRNRVHAVLVRPDRVIVAAARSEADIDRIVGLLRAALDLGALSPGAVDLGAVDPPAPTNPGP